MNASLPVHVMQRPNARELAQSFTAAVYKRVTKSLTPDGSPETVEVDLDCLAVEFADAVQEHFPGKEIKKTRIIKVDEEKHLVYGWASVTSVDGEPVCDLQGDIIDLDQLQGTIHKTMTHRRGDTMHTKKRTHEIVESMCFTKELKEELDMHHPNEGWFVVVKVHDPQTWKDVKSGKLKGFSIGGDGDREEIVEKGAKKSLLRLAIEKFNENHDAKGEFSSGSGSKTPKVDALRRAIHESYAGKPGASSSSPSFGERATPGRSEAYRSGKSQGAEDLHNHMQSRQQGNARPKDLERMIDNARQDIKDDPDNLDSHLGYLHGLQGK